MTAKLTDRERRRRAPSRVIALRDTPPFVSLNEILAATESLIRLRRDGWRERFPIADATWQDLEDLCCHRWAIMAEIARLRNGGPAK